MSDVAFKLNVKKTNVLKAVDNRTADQKTADAAKVAADAEVSRLNRLLNVKTINATAAAAALATANRDKDDVNKKLGEAKATQKTANDAKTKADAAAKAAAVPISRSVSNPTTTTAVNVTSAVATKIQTTQLIVDASNNYYVVFWIYTGSTPTYTKTMNTSATNAKMVLIPVNMVNVYTDQPTGFANLKNAKNVYFTKYTNQTTVPIKANTYTYNSTLISNDGFYNSNITTPVKDATQTANSNLVYSLPFSESTIISPLIKPNGMANQQTGRLIYNLDLSTNTGSVSSNKYTHIPNVQIKNFKAVKIANAEVYIDFSSNSKQSDMSKMPFVIWRNNRA
jgi:hypothetical protein